VDEITGPATIEQMVADAAAAGHELTVRLIRDWTRLGLLDTPLRRPAGKGHGSLPALYPETQRRLLLTLLVHRPTNGISSLARIPVGIWMYWGEAYVPLRQVRVAMATWLGDPRVSLRRARETANEVARLLDNPAASDAARARLRRTLSDIAYTGKADLAQLDFAVREVFEPGAQRIHRAVGHPAAPLTAESIVELTRARLRAAERLAVKDPAHPDYVTDAEYVSARHAHLVAYAQYATQQALLAANAPAGRSDMYEPVTAERALNDCCGNLLTALGMNSLYPQRAAEIEREPEPRIVLV
jgi:hypothetical protein